MPWPLYSHRHSPQYPLSRRLNGTQIELVHFGEEKNLLHLLGFIPWIIQPAA
jgi:hypothetical protein